MLMRRVPPLWPTFGGTFQRTVGCGCCGVVSVLTDECGGPSFCHLLLGAGQRRRWITLGDNVVAGSTLGSGVLSSICKLKIHESPATTKAKSGMNWLKMPFMHNGYAQDAASAEGRNYISACSCWSAHQSPVFSRPC
ncbi:unnamed protein product [Chrysoparadoxa australica]